MFEELNEECDQRKRTRGLLFTKKSVMCPESQTKWDSLQDVTGEMCEKSDSVSQTTKCNQISYLSPMTHFRSYL